jgi:type IV pilus assembly protein PilF
MRTTPSAPSSAASASRRKARRLSSPRRATRSTARKDGRLDKSEEYLRLALAQRKSYAEALIQMAGVSFERGNLLQARAFVERYLGAAPATPDVLLLGYQIERGLGDAAAAGSYADRLRSSHAGAPETRVIEEFSRKDSP